jgi:hypothetical protein
LEIETSTQSLWPLWEALKRDYKEREVAEIEGESDEQVKFVFIIVIETEKKTHF